MLKRTMAGINIQYPISRLLLDGTKTVETRTYPIPSRYVGKELAIIETPGKNGKFKARIIGTVVFSESFKYQDKKAFYRDIDRHHVDPSSPWKWLDLKPKWGWPILQIQGLKVPQSAPKRRGIKFTKAVSVRATSEQ